MATKPKLPVGFDDPERIRRFQASQGLSVDGLWGPKSQAAYDRYAKSGTNWLDTSSNITAPKSVSGTPLISNARPIGEALAVQQPDRDLMPQSTGGTPEDGTGSTIDTIGSIATSLAPFASNIANTFRRPPAVPAPTLNAPITLGRVNYNADRAAIERTVRGAGLAADRSLDGNTASAVRASNLATQLDATSRVNQAESNTNTEISNRQTLANAEIAAGNAAKRDMYAGQQVEREIAIQGQQSANLANAADKFVAIQNEKAKRDLDEKKFGVLSRMYSPGVLDRMQKFYKDQGINDPLNTKRANGGSIKNLKKIF